ncbi:MAG: hypothetical protein ACREP0_09570 [Rhodanobacteraceae bacterium]
MRKLILAALVAAAFSIPAFAAQSNSADPAGAAAPAPTSAPAKTTKHHTKKASHHKHHAKKAEAPASSGK